MYPSPFVTALLNNSCQFTEPDLMFPQHHKGRLYSGCPFPGDSPFERLKRFLSLWPHTALKGLE